MEPVDIGDDLLGDAAGREQGSVNAGRGHDDHDLGDQLYRAVDDAPEIGEIDFAMNHHRDEQRIDDGDAGGFRRREHAAVDSAEDDDDGAERPARAPGGAPDPLPVSSP